MASSTSSRQIQSDGSVDRHMEALSSLVESSLVGDIPIRGKIQRTSEEFEKLNPKYQTQPRKFFQRFRVFKTVWTDPSLMDDSRAQMNKFDVRERRYGQWIYQKVRWFIIVKAQSEKCLCVPIVTYGQRGVAMGVVKSSQAIAYTDGTALESRMPKIERPSETAAIGEEPLRTPIRIQTDEPGDRLNDMSRIDYGRLYTVEANVKAMAFGWVHHDSRKDFCFDFLNVFKGDEGALSKGDEDAKAWQTMQSLHDENIGTQQESRSEDEESDETNNIELEENLTTARKPPMKTSSVEPLRSVTVMQDSGTDSGRSMQQADALDEVGQPAVNPWGFSNRIDSRYPERDDSYKIGRNVEDTADASTISAHSSATTKSERVFSAPATEPEHWSKTSATNDGGTVGGNKPSPKHAASDVMSDLTMGLDSNNEQYLVDLFASTIFAHLDERQPFMGSFDILNGLLRDYANLLRNNVLSTGTEARAASFVRTRSEAIARSFQNNYVHDDHHRDMSSDPTLDEKMHLLWGKLRVSSQDPDDIDLSGVSDEVDGPDHLIPHEDVDKALNFLTKSVEFTWLLNRIRIGASIWSTGDTYSKVRQELVRSVRGNSIVQFELDWSLFQVFTEQFERPYEVPLESVICIVGTGTRAEAITCGEYIRRMWPTAGNMVLHKLNAAVHACLVSSQDTHGVDSDPPTQHLQVVVTNIGFETMTSTVILHSANQTLLVEAGEILCWLGTACRSSENPDKMSYCTPSVSSAWNGAKTAVTYSFSELEPEISDQRELETCWHLLFKNPVIAKGYPITTREPGLPGLQLSLDMMTKLAKADRVIDFDGTLLVKGLYSMFVPVQRIGRGIVWHYLLNADESWMLPNYARERCATVTCISPSHLTGATHFVGWTRTADVLAGTKAADYDAIDYPGANLAKSGIALEDITINASYNFGFEFGINTKIVPGKKDTRLPLSSSGMYEKKIHMARNTVVVLYDTRDKRAWLLDGATVLLHLTRASISHETSYVSSLGSSGRLVESLRLPNSGIKSITSAYHALLDNTNRRLPLKEPLQPDPSEPTSHAHTVRDSIERAWVLEDLVLDHFQTLEQIKAHQAKMQFRPQINIANRFSRSLHGWGFIDIIAGEPTIKPRVAGLKRSASHWLDFTDKCGAVNILGAAFGKLIEPANNECKDTVILPCGMDFMAAQVKLLQDIARKSSSDRNVDDDFLRLAENRYWRYMNRTLSNLPCKCINNPNSTTECRRNPVVEIQNAPPSGKLRKSSSKRSSAATNNEDVLRTCSLGAIIIGNRDDWKKVPQPHLAINTGRLASESIEKNSVRDSGYGTMSREPSLEPLTGVSRIIEMIPELIGKT